MRATSSTDFVVLVELPREESDLFVAYIFLLIALINLVASDSQQLNAIKSTNRHSLRHLLASSMKHLETYSVFAAELIFLIARTSSF